MLLNVPLLILCDQVMPSLALVVVWPDELVMFVVMWT